MSGDMNALSPRLGSAGDVLDFALDHLNDSYERTDFLESWRDGDVKHWPEFAKWVAVQHAGAAEASARTRPSPSEGEPTDGLAGAAIAQNDAMRQNLAHIGNLVSDLARAMRVEQANADGSWPDIAGRIAKLIEAALRQPTTAADEGRRSIMLEMAAADDEQRKWERRFSALCRMYPIERIFADQDGKWGLRDFLDYAGEVCGFDAYLKGADQ